MKIIFSLTAFHRLCYNEKRSNNRETYTIMQIEIIKHPLVQHKLTLMRKKETSSNDFRRLLREITMLMGYEITRDLPLEDIPIETPMEKATGKRLSGKKLGIVPVLRAGFGMVDGLLELIPSARVGVIGLYRDPKTLKPVEYYCKLPDVTDRHFVIVDPMLATGGSSSAAITLLKEHGVKNIKLMCLVAAPEGVKKVNQDHPDVPIFTAGLDDRLNEHGYILPGLGDAGDRIFGTK
jgi:uracil phosphoribosyltransferase